MISRERVDEILEFDRKANVDDATCCEFNITHETLARYRRWSKEQPAKEPVKPTLPRILSFDIETAPARGEFWGLFKQNIGINQILKDPFIICWSAKWLGEDEILSSIVSPSAARDGNDGRVAYEMWRLLNEADIVVAQNGDRFDIPWVNARLLLWGMPPPIPYQTVDTLKVLKKFKFISRKLDYISGLFFGRHKLKTEHQLWTRCGDGDREALAEMLAYNKEDVVLLEDLYLLLRPWIKGHPNLNLFTDETVCPACGKPDLLPIEGKFYGTKVGKYPILRCKCGHIAQTGENQLKNTKHIPRSVAR